MPDGARRWVGTVLVAVLVATVCVLAGLWQWQRHSERVATNELIASNLDVPARPLEDVLDRDGALPPAREWSPARAVVRYLDPEPVLLRNRPVEGRPAVRLLHPAEVVDGPLTGRVLVLDRGWVPVADGGDGAVPSAPAGEVVVELRLRVPEPDDGSADGRQVRRIAPEVVLEAGAAAGRPDAPLGVVALVLREDGAAPSGTGTLPVPRPELGSHLSYAFQWWVFALGALVGAVVLIRRDRRADGLDASDDPDGAGDPNDTTGPTVTAPSRGRRRRPTAEEEEDALLDAQAPSAAPRS